MLNRFIILSNNKSEKKLFSSIGLKYINEINKFLFKDYHFKYNNK